MESFLPGGGERGDMQRMHLFNKLFIVCKTHAEINLINVLVLKKVLIWQGREPLLRSKWRRDTV